LRVHLGIRFVNIIEFIRDPKLINGDLSPYQEVGLRLLYGLPLDQEQTEIAKLALDVTELPAPRNYVNGTFVCSRRSGKTDRLTGNITAFETVYGNHKPHLTPGERAHIVLVTQDLRAVRVLYRYVLGKFENSDILSQMIDSVRA